MKKMFFIFSAIILGIFLGYLLYSQVQDGTEGIICSKQGTDYSLSLHEARVIASTSSCIEKGAITEEYSCNEITGTWWLGFEPYEPLELCPNPACVVNVQTKEAEINWMCTGALG